MCASYGLGGGPYDENQRVGLHPLDLRENQVLLNQWMLEQSATAKITGRKALNFNPLIRADAAGSRELSFAWWWLWLDGRGPAKFSAFNSRDDALVRSWSRPFQRRALLPASWYVEKGVRFELPGTETFAIAALTSTVVDDATGDALISYSMVTRESLGEAARTWHRMPLILPAEMHDEWLDPSRKGDESLAAAIQLASVETSEAVTAAPLPPSKSVGEPILF